MKLLWLLVLLVPVAIMLWALVLQLQTKSQQSSALHGLVEKVRDLAWDNDPLDPDFCGAVLGLLKQYDALPSDASARRTLDAVLELCRARRESSPELSVIFIDTIRSRGELG